MTGAGMSVCCISGLAAGNSAAPPGLDNRIPGILRESSSVLHDVVFFGAFTRELRGYLISVFLITQSFSLGLKRGKLQGVTGEYLERSALLRI